MIHQELISQQVAEKLGLSYKSARELNAIIDKKMPTTRPTFVREEILVAGEAFEVYFRDIVECIKALYGDPEFAPFLLLAPEEHYTDASQSVRVYFEMNTGRWWWITQVRCTVLMNGLIILIIMYSKSWRNFVLVQRLYPSSSLQIRLS